LPAKVLKIDQSFVRDMLDDPDDLAILEGVLGLATAFSRESIALVMRHARGDTSDVHHHLEELLAMRDQLTQQLSRLIQADPG
jgi:predicted signal transduction protein with EAL and GGDEF domain